MRSILRASCRILSILPLATCLLLIPIIATADCPTTTVMCKGTDPGGVLVFYVYDESSGPQGEVAFTASSASYNLTEGKLTAVANVYEADTHVSRVVAADRFELHNVAGAFVTIRLNLSFTWVADNYRMAFAAAYARLEAQGQSVEAQSVGPSPGLARFIELEVIALEGVPFEITYEAEASGWGYYPWSTVGAQLEFIGLPAGAYITSCNGFGTTPVSTEASTWGKVKALYR